MKNIFHVAFTLFLAVSSTSLPSFAVAVVNERSDDDPNPGSKKARIAQDDAEATLPAHTSEDLREAAARGDLETLNQLLLDGRFNAPKADGRTALHAAAALGQVEALRVLLADGRFNAPTADGLTALHVAAAHGQVEALRVLLADGRFNAPTANGRTALHAAAERGQVEALRVLLADGRFNAPTANGETALLAAAIRGQVEALRVLLTDGRFNAPRANGLTALHAAAARGQVEALRVLLADGRFNAPAAGGATALHAAADRGQVEALRVLLADGRFNAPRANGLTALHAAAERGQVEALRVLLADGRFNAPAADGRTALHIAARNGHANIVRQLILHFGWPESAFGVNYRTIADEDRIRPDIAQMIRDWARPVWNPRYLELYPQDLRNALFNWLLTARRLGQTRDQTTLVARQIVANFYADPQGWNPYNQRNTERRLTQIRDRERSLWDALVNPQPEGGSTNNALTDLQTQLAQALTAANPAIVAGVLAMFFASHWKP